MPDTAPFMRFHAGALDRLKTGDTVGARRLLEEGIAEARVQARTNHPDFLAILWRLGHLERFERRFAVAERIHLEMLAIAESRFDPSHELIQGACNDLGLDYFGADRYPEAHTMFARAIDMSRQSGRADLRATWAGNLGRLFLAEGKVDEAEKALAESISASTASAGRRPDSEADLLFLMGLLHYRHRTKRSAIPWFERAYEGMTAQAMEGERPWLECAERLLWCYCEADLDDSPRSREVVRLFHLYGGRMSPAALT